jgi:hypothetical protein
MVGWKHITVTLLKCHIILLSKDVHVCVYPTSNFWKFFTIFLHIMLKYSLGKKLEKNIYIYISCYKVGDWSIFVEMNVMYLCIQKHKYILETI